MTAGNEAADPGNGQLQKHLGLRDVYAISAGAMFSSGFFLLPGIAVATAGSAAPLAYLIAGLLMIPSMLSMLELATALPRAGGAYYFVDRSLGPAAGTVAGIGTWLTLVLKSAFALVGMGAYLAITPGIARFIEPGTASTVWLMKLLAILMTVIFVVVNLWGVKETTRLQRLLVSSLLAVLALFVIEGLWHVMARLPEGQLAANFDPVLPADQGWHGLFSTVGLVFVSYAGLTQVASVSEEVRRPERNLPWGMFLSLASSTVVYVFGTFIAIAVLGPARLTDDYAPIGTAAAAFGQWLPGSTLLILVIVASIAAFLSTGNAGILAAGRYPLALARDRLVPAGLGGVGKSGTPTTAIVVTGALIMILILLLPVQDVAKLGSTFNLLVFGLVNLALVVMRESRIESYDPSFRAPLYPWLPIAGILISGWLIFEMGLLSIAFSCGIIVLSLLWYIWYARPKIERSGAVNYVFARLGRYRHPGLQVEFRQIMKEKGLRDEDPYDLVVERAPIIEFDSESFEEILNQSASCLADGLPLSADELIDRIRKIGWYEGIPISEGAALFHFRSPRVDSTRMVLARSKRGFRVELPPDVETEPSEHSCKVFLMILLVSGNDKPGQHFRIIAELAKRIEDESFMAACRHIESHQRLKELLLHDAGFLELFIGEHSSTETLVDTKIAALELPPGAFIAGLRRNGTLFEPRGETRLKRHDTVIFIGEPKAIDHLAEASL